MKKIYLMSINILFVTKTSANKNKTAKYYAETSFKGPAELKKKLKNFIKILQVSIWSTT